MDHNSYYSILRFWALNRRIVERMADYNSYYTILWFSTYCTLLPAGLEYMLVQSKLGSLHFFLKEFLSIFMRLYYLINTDVQSIMLTSASSLSKS